MQSAIADLDLRTPTLRRPLGHEVRVLTSRYLTTVKNLPQVMRKIVEGAAPTTFNREHLTGIGFGASGDRAIVPLLKDLGFLSSEGAPTQRYHAYRDQSRSRKVLGEALREAYADLFLINENISEKDRPAVLGKFKSTHNVTDRVAEQQAMTFFALLALADISKGAEVAVVSPAPLEPPEPPSLPEPPPVQAAIVPLRYNIEVHLPATKDVEVYNAIFKSLREHLLA